MKNKYYIIDDGDSVHISLKDDEECLNAFIDIYIDGIDISSPLKNTEDARLFAEIIVKLLEQIT